MLTWAARVMADARSTKNPIKKYTLMIMGYIVSTTYKPEEVSCNAVAGICDENQDSNYSTSFNRKASQIQKYKPNYACN